MRKCLISLLLGCNFMLSGCYGAVEVNNTVVPTGRGIDFKEGKIIYSSQIAKPQGKESSEQDEATLVISETAESVGIAARRMYLFLPRKPLWSMITTTIIGEELAREDIYIFADFLTRNSNVRLNTSIFAAYQATAEEVLKVKMPMGKYSANNLVQLIRIQENQLGVYMEVNLRDFLYKAATAGVEPVLPQLIIEKKGEEERLKLDGTAVFLNGKMVGSLNEEESRGLRFLSPKQITGGLFLAEVFPERNERKVTLELLRSKAEKKQIFEDGKIIMQIKIKAEGNFYEQNNSIDYLTIENIPIVERAANKAIKNDVVACIAKAQSLNSDVLGWGQDISRKKPELWKDLEENWPEFFSEIESQVTVDFKLRRTYKTNTVFKYKN